MSSRQLGLFVYHLAEHLALCVAPQPSSPDPSTLVALSAVHAISDPAHADVQVVPAGPCGPKKTQENPIEVCPDNQKANLVIVQWCIQLVYGCITVLQSHRYNNLTHKLLLLCLIDCISYMVWLHLLI